MRISVSMRTLLATAVVVIVAASAWVLVDWLVVTDTERIDGMLGEAAKAVERKDLDFMVEKCLNADFKFGRLDREGWREWAKDAMTRFEVRNFKKYSAEIKVKGETAHATMRTFVSGGRIPGDVRLDWEIELRKRDSEHWGMESVRVFFFLAGERREIDPEEILRHAGDY